ncbi:MAG: hypothetical protein ACTSXZ_03405 [Alphaproteobacteria bacterium]
MPGKKEPFALGPLRFGMSLAEFKAAFAGKELDQDNYDTPRGQTWSVIDPFGDDLPEPKWLTADAEQISATFWDDCLLRVRLHYDLAFLPDLLAIKEKFDRGYEFEVDQSQGENMFLEYNAPDMKIFITGGGDENAAVSFVDLPAYRAMDAARRRWKKQASQVFELHGLKFGIGLGAAEMTFGQTMTPSDFYEGLESQRWVDEESGREWELGFDANLGLTAIAILYKKRWSPDQVEEKVMELTKKYGQGQIRMKNAGYTMVIDAYTLRVSLMVIDCNAEGCMVSEGWLWSGPAE